MKFKLEITINKPVDEVVEIWKNDELLDQWQDDFISKKLVSGEPLQKGTVSVFKYKFGSKEMELKETILKSDLPNSFEGLYEHEHMDNTQTTIFESISENQTNYITEVDYFKFKAWLPKVLFKLFPGMFKKKSLKWMEQFKALVEKA